MKEITKIYITDETSGQVTEIEGSKYANDFARQHSVPGHDGLEPEQVVTGLISMAAAKADLPDGAESFATFYETIKEVVEESEKLKKEFDKQAEAAKAKADEEKKAAAEAKKQEKADLENRQNIFLVAASSAMSKADDDLREQLVDMKNHLPTGIGLHVSETGGFSMTFESDVKEADLASAIGYMAGQERNNSLLRGAYQFCIGELANELMKRGLYPSMIKCAAALSEKVAADGFNLNGRLIESYARMAVRIPEEMRNPKADSTAYLVVSDMPYPPKPSAAKFPDKKELEVAKAEWEKEKVKVDEERAYLAGLLKQGSYTFKDEDGKEITKPMLTKSDIQPMVDKAKVKLGLKKEADENKKTVSWWLRQFYEASMYWELFQGIHAKSVLRVRKAECVATFDLTKKDVETMLEQATLELQTIFFGDKFAAIKAGLEVREVQVMHEVDGKKVAKKGEDGKLIKENQEFKVYPIMYSLES
jgi:hypothetical protein